MFTNPVRFTLVGLAFTVSVIAFARGEWPIALLYLTAALLLVVSYFRNGTLWLASRAYRRQDPDKAEKLLAQIKAPHPLAAARSTVLSLPEGNPDLPPRQARRSGTSPDSGAVPRPLEPGLGVHEPLHAGHHRGCPWQSSAGAATPGISPRAPPPRELDKMIASTEEKIATAAANGNTVHLRRLT